MFSTGQVLSEDSVGVYTERTCIMKLEEPDAVLILALTVCKEWECHLKPVRSRVP